MKRGKTNPEALEPTSQEADISIVFDLIDSGEPTNIARDKDKMIGEAVWDEYLRSVGRRPKRPGP